MKTLSDRLYELSVRVGKFEDMYMELEEGSENEEDISETLGTIEKTIELLDQDMEYVKDAYKI